MAALEIKEVSVTKEGKQLTLGDITSDIMFFPADAKLCLANSGMEGEVAVQEVIFDHKNKRVIFKTFDLS